jgi:hypothetical protein
MDRARYILEMIKVEVIVDNGGYNVQPVPVRYSVSILY